MNTFTDREWGEGDESESVFDPANFDADQIVRVAKAAGMKGLVLTCKHHDGFCLWPSAYTTHSVKNSKWMDGQGDVVKAISSACRKQGLKFGIYLSPWDRNHADYGTPKYLDFYRKQLRELLTQYGPISEVWFDGANGGSGYYGGARETRTIDAQTYYQWSNTWQIVRELQPNAVMFSDVGPDIRWVGNEDGLAGDPCWDTVDPTGWFPGKSDDDKLFHGCRPFSPDPALRWIPAECDVSIRPGWFYHSSEDTKVKTARELLDIYYNSIGHGASLILNIPPDRNGQIHSNDAASLHEFRRIIDATFARNLAAGAKVTASNVRGNDPQFSAKNVLNENPDAYWTTDDSIANADLVLDLGSPRTFNVVELREYLPLGQRIEGFALARWQDGKWIEFAAGTSIGNRRLIRTNDIRTEKVRVRITKAAVCPALSKIGLFAEPKLP
ncbi:MAG TPA: alpha-L-fucosidase [Verrucomicrobiae bacterium]|nr:alpha-L-fucosidase [Verrucomicrobiae bacterium]